MTMASPSENNSLSILDLVASDAAYKTLKEYTDDRVAGRSVYLQSVPDSTYGNEANFPSVLALSLPNEGLTAYSLDTVSGKRDGGSAQQITFTNWVLIKKFQDPNTGFGAAIFKSNLQVDGKNQFIVPFKAATAL